MLEWSQVREERRRRGWTQVELARLVGVTQGSISQIERGVSPASLTLSRIERALRDRRKVDTHSHPRPRASLAYAWPPARDAEKVVGLQAGKHRLHADVWQRSADGGAFGGDFVVTRVLDDGNTLVVVADMTGHGQTVVPARFWVEGWLTAWMTGLTALPRLEVVARALSRALRSQDLSAAVQLLAFSGTGRGLSTSVELLSCGFPTPLIIEESCGRVVSPPSMDDALPWPNHAISENVVVSRCLYPPWRIALATDGLLARLGGDEAGGKRKLRFWQAGDWRDFRPSLQVGKDAPLDDELLVVIVYDQWDEEITTMAYDHEPIDRFARLIETRYAASYGEARTTRFIDAFREAILNVRTHAYDGDNGLLRLRLRAEQDSLRVEIEDDSDRTFDSVLTGNDRPGGLDLITRRTDGHEVRHSRAGGNILTMILEQATEGSI